MDRKDLPWYLAEVTGDNDVDNDIKNIKPRLALFEARAALSEAMARNAEAQLRRLRASKELEEIKESRG